MKRITLGVFASTVAILLASTLSLQCATRSNDTDAGVIPADGGPTVDGGVAADGGTPTDGGTGSDGGQAATDTTILQIQSDQVSPATCVRVTGVVVMSLVHDDPDDTFLADGGRVPRKAFFISAGGLTTAEPRKGIQVVVNTDQPTPTVSPGDELTLVAEYNEQFGNSTLRVGFTCGSITTTGSVSTPAPALVTIAQIGQSGNPLVDGANAEDYEGVLVKITAGKVSASKNNFGLFEITDDGTNKIEVATTQFSLTVAPGVNDTVNEITGLAKFSFDRRKVVPRSDAEVSTTAGVVNCGGAAKADHLLLTEIKVGPTAGEFIEIHNPTASPIDLTNYYLYSATHPGGTDSDGGAIPERQYYNVVSGTEFAGDGLNGDFAMQFPTGATIAAGGYQIVAITGAPNYCSQNPDCSCTGAACTGTGVPDYELPAPSVAGGDTDVPNMRGSWDMRIDQFSTFGYLTRSDESVVLFQWDGVAATVKDVDYFLWGTDNDERTDKTGISTYLADTPKGSQKSQPSLTSQDSATLSYQRVCMNEGAEAKTGGNGISGHNETGEDLDQTFVIKTPTPKAATVGATP